MSETDTRGVSLTLPMVQGEQATLIDHAQATSFEQTQANLAGQLSRRSQRLYAGDVEAFLWWLRAYRSGEALPGRYKDHAPQDQPPGPAEAAALLSPLTRDEVIAYRTYLDAPDPADPEGHRRLYAKKTAIRRLTVLRRLCAEAVFKGLLAENPTVGVRGFKGDDDETPHQALQLEELRTLLKAIGTRTLKDLRDQALLTVLGWLGLRREEASELNWSDFQHRQGHQVLHIRHGKGDQPGVAKVPVDVARLLEQYRAALGEETLPMFVVLRKGSHLRRDEVGQVIRLDGKGIERITAQRGVAASLELGQTAQGKPKRLTPHDLRATFITLALEGKALLQTVQYAARHKDPRTTEHYQRRKVNLDDNAVDYIHY